MMAMNEYLVIRAARPVNEVDIYCRSEKVDPLYLRVCSRFKGIALTGIKSPTRITRDPVKKNHMIS